MEESKPKLYELVIREVQEENPVIPGRLMHREYNGDINFIGTRTLSVVLTAEQYEKVKLAVLNNWS